MRLASFIHEGRATYGLVTEQGLLPAPGEFLRAHPTLRQALADGALAALARSVQGGVPLVPESVRFLPVIPEPHRILCVGVNYLEHIREMGRELPEHPTLFVRFPETLVGHGEPLEKPAVSEQYDYEGELAVVVGRRARNLTESDALDCIAGYTCFMDGSVRDWQRHTSQFIPGKNFPATGSAGPWLLTADEIPDPGRLRLATRVNGETLQSAPASDLCIGIPRILAYCSAFCRLEPGDIIATGTPSGVGFARTPPRWLAPGDVVEVEIDGIGTLRNPVVDERHGEGA